SHNPTWTTEIDRFEYRPNPGGVMAPRSGQDVSLKSILLKANGNISSWSYRWALNWSYTFWRPSAPAFPLSSEGELLAGDGRTVTASRVGGEKNGSQPTAPATMRALDQAAAATLPAFSTQSTSNGDSITIDRQSKTITLVIR